MSDLTITLLGVDIGTASGWDEGGDTASVFYDVELNDAGKQIILGNIPTTKDFSMFIDAFYGVIELTSIDEEKIDVTLDFEALGRLANNK